MRAAPLVLLAALLATPLAAAQTDAASVADVLRAQRLDARIAEILADAGPVVAPRPPRALSSPDPYSQVALDARAAAQARRDSLARARADSLAQIVRLDAIDWDRVPADEQGTFIERFRETYWVSAAPRGLPIDTVETRELRGRLQYLFGKPTRNADALRQENYSGSEFVQFEYWFVVNDSIPALVLDIDGPFGNGLVLAGSEAHERELALLKADLSERLMRGPGPDPYVDYYHSFDRRAWYRTGYNGVEFFTVGIRAPRWSFADRPQRWVIHR